MPHPKDLGWWFAIELIPSAHDKTAFIDVGRIRIGIELRTVNDDLVNEAYDAATMAPFAEMRAERPTDDAGVSIHVYEQATGKEFIRFDCFDEDPHYHYIMPGKGHTRVTFDRDADGHMLEWALHCVKERLPAMLTRAGASELAASVDQQSIDTALPLIEAAAYRLGREGNPSDSP